MRWHNAEESENIIHEAKTLFRKNRNLRNPQVCVGHHDVKCESLDHHMRGACGTQVIESKIFEAESRHGLGVHYMIPYPRPYYVPTGSRVNDPSYFNHNPEKHELPILDSEEYDFDGGYRGAIMHSEAVTLPVTEWDDDTPEYNPMRPAYMHSYSLRPVG